MRLSWHAFKQCIVVTAQFKPYTCMWVHVCICMFYMCRVYNVMCIFIIAHDKHLWYTRHVYLQQSYNVKCTGYDTYVGYLCTTAAGPLVLPPALPSPSGASPRGFANQVAPAFVSSSFSYSSFCCWALYRCGACAFWLSFQFHFFFFWEILIKLDILQHTKLSSDKVQRQDSSFTFLLTS